MNILFTVEFYSPRIGGAEEVVKQLAERLVGRGHRVTVATSFENKRVGSVINGVIVEQFRIKGNRVRGIKGAPEEVERYRSLLRSNFDVILNYAAQSWPTDLALPLLSGLRAKKVMVPCGYSGLHNPRYAEYFAGLPEHLREYDRLVYMSPNYQDKLYGDRHRLGEKAALIPNGAAKEEFESLDTFRIREKLGITTPYLLICVANHYLGKNHGFVIEAFRRMRRSDATLLIVGDSDVSYGIRKVVQLVAEYGRCRLHALRHPNIRLANGIDRQLVLSAYKSADLFLFGSKLECAPLVMYESFAAGVPFLTTDVGNVKDHAQAITIVHTPEEMAVAANDLLDHPDRREMLKQEGQRVWQDGRSWESITDQYEALFTA